MGRAGRGHLLCAFAVCCLTCWQSPCGDEFNHTFLDGVVWSVAWLMNLKVLLLQFERAHVWLEVCVCWWRRALFRDGYEMSCVLVCEKVKIRGRDRRPV